MELRNNVLHLVAFVLGKSRNWVHYAQSLENDLQLDSIDRLDLIFKIENYYGVELSADQVENVATVDDLCRCLQNALEQTQAAA